MNFRTPTLVNLRHDGSMPFFAVTVLNRWQDMSMWLSKNDVMYLQKEIIYGGMYALPMKLEMDEADAITFKLVFGL